MCGVLLEWKKKRKEMKKKKSQNKTHDCVEQLKIDKMKNNNKQSETRRVNETFTSEEVTAHVCIKNSKMKRDRKWERGGKNDEMNEE